MPSTKYSLSYTAASLRIQDTLLVAQAFKRNDFTGIDEKIGNGKTATGRRIRAELVKRLKTLTNKQLDFMLEAGLDDARKMVFVAVCKTYDFIHQFVVEVLREKMFQLDYEITEGEYFSFFDRKCESHPELEALSDTTVNKIRQVLFKILEETKMIDSIKNKVLQLQFVSKEFQEILREDDPSLLRIFFMTDADIDL